MHAFAPIQQSSHFQPFGGDSMAAQGREKVHSESRAYVGNLIQGMHESRMRLEQLYSNYQIGGDVERRFLQRNEYLVPILEEAVEHIRTLFTEGSPLVVKLFQSQEENGDSELTVRIPTTLSPSEAALMLDRFDEEWWLDVVNRAEGKLFFTVEFV